MDGDELADVRRSMADLGGRMSVLEATVDTVTSDLYNHGKDGIKTQWTRFMAVYEERESRRDRAWSMFRWTVGTIIAAGVLALGLMEFAAHVGRGELKAPHIFTTSTLEKVYAKTKPQDAGLPSSYTAAQSR